MSIPTSQRMPAVFFGHGNPMNALEQNGCTEAWQQIGSSMPRPSAILAVSAHWYIHGTAVTAMDSPRTIHDFGGFPRALFEFQYPAPGNPALARRVRDLLAPLEVRLDEDWGLDHGVWSVLAHAFPQADVPVVQLSIDATQPAAFHYQLGKALAPLRDEGVLIMGSGNVVHNLATIKWGNDAPTYDWAVRFDARVRDCLERHDHAPLINYENLDADARLAVPTPEHYLPLLYVIAQQGEHESITFACDGIQNASISMLTAVIG